MAVEPSCHDFLIKTKFNREEVVKLKSLYDSTVALALRMDNRAGERGVPKGLLLEALAGFGFDTSPNLLSQLLNHKPFINWDNFLRLMESLIHKNSSESLDEYLDTLPTKDRLSYEQVVQIIRFGLEKLIMYIGAYVASRTASTTATSCSSPATFSRRWDCPSSNPCQWTACEVSSESSESTRPSSISFFSDYSHLSECSSCFVSDPYIKIRRRRTPR